MASEVEVTQADRDAVYGAWKNGAFYVDEHVVDDIFGGGLDSHPVAQAFARHRINALSAPQPSASEEKQAASIEEAACSETADQPQRPARRWMSGPTYQNYDARSSASVDERAREAEYASLPESVAQEVSDRLRIFGALQSDEVHSAYENVVKASRQLSPEGEGWVRVPVEPTDAMLDAYDAVLCREPGESWRVTARAEWQAMIAAAPAGEKA